MPIPGPHSSILQIGRRSQDTAYRILHARIQHTGYYMQGYRTHRTHRIQDEGHIGCRIQDTGHIGYRMQEEYSPNA